MDHRVLVVEDDPQNSYLVRFLLERAGYEVILAVDGEQAVSVAQRERPDIVLMDMLLPQMDGYEATRRIHAVPELADTPVIALTAYAMKGDKERIFAAGCVDHISKPIDPEGFIAEMERHLPGR